MFGLLQRLSALDADAASALRVIGFFDALVEHGASIDVILRQTAILTECLVGVRTADGHLSERVEPSGAVHFGGPLANSHVYRLPSGDEVWLERDGGSGVHAEVHLYPGTFHGSSMIAGAAVAQRMSRDANEAVRRLLRSGAE